jgi:hypothetical protein
VLEISKPPVLDAYFGWVRSTCFFFATFYSPHCFHLDHHCPWVNNCIGYFNHGHFLRFLFYVDATCTYHLFMVTRRVMTTTNYYVSPPKKTRFSHADSTQDIPSGFEFLCILLNYVLVGPVILAVGAFRFVFINHGNLSLTVRM